MRKELMRLLRRLLGSERARQLALDLLVEVFDRDDEPEQPEKPRAFSGVPLRSADPSVSHSWPPGSAGEEAGVGLRRAEQAPPQPQPRTNPPATTTREEQEAASRAAERRQRV